MKHLKIYESFDFNEDDFDWDEENDNLKSGDYVNISTLYDKYPNWSKDNRYMDAVTNNKVLKINNVTLGAENHDPTKDEKLLTRFLGDLMPYFSSNIIFDQSNVREVAGDEILDWTVGMEGLLTITKTYYRDFFPNVEWLQQITAD